MAAAGEAWFTGCSTCAGVTVWQDVPHSWYWLIEFLLHHLQQLARLLRLLLMKYAPGVLETHG